MFALTDCTLFDGSRWLPRHALVIEGETIAAVLPQERLDTTVPRRSLGGALLSAGFIDLQLNGCGGVMFNNAISLDTLATMHQANLKSGTTSFLPTLITSPDQDMHQAVSVIRDYMGRHRHQVLGLHLEGPYTNIQRKGIHPEQQIRALDEPMLAFLCANADVVKKITLAPECNRPEHIARLRAAGILVSMGHTAASYEQAMAGFDAGIGFATHLYNAMTPTLNGREPGAVGAVYDHPHVYAGIVVDGFHVHSANVRLAHKVLGERLCLVTDATAAAGAEPGFSQFDFCGATVYLRDGQCIDQHGTLGGSALTMMTGVRNLVVDVGLSLDEALRMASLYPARALGVEHRLGTIAVGKVANLVAFDRDYKVKATLVNGTYKAQP
ncbi:N-acetylglucosamine-6-phosphate deacetylase [Zobellella aerophila]|uniref:N-acetylglucosamine-6-phosphate deacetylase n=1 Tax=Zobellella aerophila TaxID=870480 RepID=A0ABP6VF50_9GAMM